MFHCDNLFTTALVFRGDTPQLYQVLPEKAAAGGVGRNMMASAHVYDVNPVSDVVEGVV